MNIKKNVDNKRLTKLNALSVILMAMMAVTLSNCTGTAKLNRPDMPVSIPVATQNKSTVTSSNGGTVALGTEVTLNVPGQSLQSNTVISIEKIADIPAGVSDGFSSFGQAYRFSPAGTTFSLDKPAVMTIKYDAQAMTAQGLDPRTTQIYYFDTTQGRYIAVRGQVDTTTGEVTAYVEHFTVYVPMAKAMIPGNNPPTANLQTPIPLTIRANSTIYIRATARDYDIGGAVSGVKVWYRKLNTGTWYSGNMTAETGVNNIDNWGYLIPSTFLTSADLIGGNDLEYYVEATDNLGVKTTSAVQAVNVTTWYQPGTLALSPANQSMSAGFSRSFTLSAKDWNGTVFNLVPDSFSVTNAIGTVTSNPVSAQLNFRAEKTAVGSVVANLGAANATSTITVFNGAIDHINILDNLQNPFSGTFQIKEGQVYAFDARGYDAFNNAINILPDWATTPDPGASLGQPIGLTNGVLYTLDGNGSGTVTASLGNRSAVQWVQVMPRTWIHEAYLNMPGMVHCAHPSFASSGSTLYTAAQHFNGTQWLIYVQTRNANGTWTLISPWLNYYGSHAYVPKIAVVGGSLFVTFYELNGTNYDVIVAWQSGGAWQKSLLSNILPGPDASYPDIAAVETSPGVFTPYVIWSENNKAYVKHFDGTNWVQDGSALNFITGFPKIAANGSAPYIAGVELDVNGVKQLVVRIWNGISWNLVGTIVNIDPAKNINPETIDLQFEGNSPVVSFGETDAVGLTKLHVSKWNGTNWVALGGALNTDPLSNVSYSDLAVFTDAKTALPFGITITTPYVAWIELPPGGGGNLYVKHWNGTTWIQNGGVLSLWNTANTQYPSLLFVNSDPYLTWSESNPVNGFWHTPVKVLR